MEKDIAICFSNSGRSNSNYNLLGVAMKNIFVMWKNGTVEEIDTADSEGEANYLVNEYKMAFQNAFIRIWFQDVK